jgi:hypothetical protein
VDDGRFEIVQARVARFTLQQYAASASGPNVYWTSRSQLDTNASERQFNRDDSEFASADGVAGSKDTGVLTAGYATTVGAHLSISGRVSTVASAYGSGASAVANFSNTFKAESVPAAGFEGLSLVYDVGSEPVNQPPACTDGSESTAEDTALSASLSCTDADGTPLTYSVVSGPSHGTLSAIGTEGTFTYTPEADYNGPDSFTFKANDGEADSQVATFAVSVTAGNDQPVCDNGSGSTDEGEALTGTVSCTDPDADPLTYTVANGPAHGTLSAIAGDGSFTYTPNPGYFGSDSFTYAASDGKGGTSTATYTISVERVLVGPPLSKDECKDGGWQRFNNPTFRNQGECVSHVASA